MTQGRKTGKFAIFYSLLTQMGIPHTDRRDFIFDFTEGQYTSLADLYEKDQDLYNWMIAQMQIKVAEYRSENSKLRKRVIASIFAYFEKIGQKVSIDYVKAVACRSTGYGDFNKIPPERLRNVYNSFNNKVKDFESVSKITQQKLARMYHLN